MLEWALLLCASGIAVVIFCFNKYATNIKIYSKEAAWSAKWIYARTAKYAFSIYVLAQCAKLIGIICIILNVSGSTGGYLIAKADGFIFIAGLLMIVNSIVSFAKIPVSKGWPVLIFILGVILSGSYMISY